MSQFFCTDQQKAFRIFWLLCPTAGTSLVLLLILAMKLLGRGADQFSWSAFLSILSLLVAAWVFGEFLLLLMVFICRPGRVPKDC